MVGVMGGSMPTLAFKTLVLIIAFVTYQPGDLGQVTQPLQAYFSHHKMGVRKQRHYFAKKGPSSQGYGFSSGHVWM